MVCYGSLGRVRCVKALRGGPLLGEEWQSWLGLARRGEVWQGAAGQSRRGKVGTGEARYDKVWLGPAVKARRGVACRGG
jgi:hypothetical protein